MQGTLEALGGHWVLDDAVLVGVPCGLDLQPTHHYQVDGWLHVGPDGAPELEVFAIESLEVAPPTRFAGRTVLSVRSAAPSLAHERAGFVDPGIDVAHAVVHGAELLMVAGVSGKDRGETLTALRCLWLRHLGATTAAASFLLHDEAPPQENHSQQVDRRPLPTEMEALFVELERRVCATANFVPGRNGILAAGCLLGIERGKSQVRIARTGLHRIYKVRNGEPSVVVYEHSLEHGVDAASVAHRQAAHSNKLLRNVVMSYWSSDGGGTTEPLVTVDLEPDASLVIVSEPPDIAEELVEACVALGHPTAIAARLRELTPAGTPSRLAVTCIGPVEAEPAKSAATGLPYSQGSVAALRDSLVQKGELPKWVNPVDAEEACGLRQDTWLTVEGLYAEQGHFEAPRFEGMHVSHSGGQASLLEGLRYRIEGYLCAADPGFPPQIHARGIEALTESPGRSFGTVRVKGYRPEAREHGDNRDVAAPVSRFDALAMETGSGVEVHCHLLPSSASRAEAAPASLFTVLESLASPAGEPDRSDMAACCIAMVKGSAGGDGSLTILEQRATKVWRWRHGRIELLRDGVGGPQPFEAGDVFFIGCGEGLDLPALASEMADAGAIAEALRVQADRSVGRSYGWVRIDVSHARLVDATG